MPIEYAFEDDVMVLRMVGSYVPADIRATLVKALASAERPRLRGLLFDVRDSGVLATRSARDIRAMAAFLAHLAPEYGNRLALVASEDLGYGLMRMGEADVDAAGVATNTFREPEAARAWLRSR